MVDFNCILSLKRELSEPTEPVTLTEVKSHLNITFSDYDTYLTDMIEQVRELAEEYTGSAIVAQTITVAVRNDLGGIYLPFGPVVGTPTVTDSDDAAVTDAEFQGVDFLQLMTKSSYLKLVYTAGYTTVPAGLKRAILEEIAYQWNHRGDESVPEISPQAKSKFKKYKKTSWLL